MKKAKKLASVLLAFLLVLSCFTTGFSAFALESEEPNTAIEDSFNEESTDTEETIVEPDVAAAVEEYNRLMEIKDSLTPEQEEALREAEKTIIDFGLNCTDKLTSPEAIEKYNQLFSSVIDSTDKKLDEIDLTDSLSAFRTMATKLAATAEETETEFFIRIVNSIEEPYDNVDIAMVKTAYEQLPDNAEIPAEVMEKYRAILACIGPDIPSTDLPDLSGYERTVVTYPVGASKSQVEQAIPNIDDLIDTILPLFIEGMDDGLNAYIQNDLYTNKTVGELAKALSALGELLFGDKASYALTLLDCFIAVYPDTYYVGETETGDIILAGAAQKLLDVASVEDPEAFEEAWNSLTFENGDFGFEDGDKEGFKDALASLFLPYGPLIDMLNLQMTNTIDTENGTYTYGGYEGLIPILEMLDLKGIISSHEFTLFVEDRTSEENDPNQLRTLESWLRPLMDPIFNLIDDLGAAPFETVMDLLPKLAYMLKTDMLDTQLFTAIEMMGISREQINGLLAEAAPDTFPNGLSLKTGDIFDLVAPMLENITVEEEVIDEETGEVITPATTISIKLDREKFIQFINDLGGCGDAAVKDSVAGGTAYRLGLDSDKADAFVVTFRWLYSELTTDENIDSFKVLIDSSDLDSPVKFLLKTVLSVAANMSADNVIVLLVNMLAPSTPDIDGNLPQLPQLPETPQLPSIGDNGDSSGISGIVDTIKGFLGLGGDDNSGDANSNSGGSSQTENPSIPSGGGKVTMSAFAVAFAAAAVIGAVTLKKKEDND